MLKLYDFGKTPLQKEDRIKYMRIVEIIKDSGNLIKTLMHDEIDDRYYLVSSIQNDYANETMVFECDEYGIVYQYLELLVTRPSNHDKIVKMMSDDDFHLDSEQIINDSEN